MSSPVVRFEVFGGDHAPDARWEDFAEPYEHARVAALREPSDRVAYVGAHLLLREVAAHLLGEPVEQLVLRQQCPGCGATGHGRPALRDHPDIALSLSHAVRRRPGQPDRVAIAALAVRSTRPVGIDVEFRGSRVPDRALTPAERAAVADGVDPVLLWTRKEACVKAGLATLDTLAGIEVWSDVTPEWVFGDWAADDGAADDWAADDPAGTEAVGSWVTVRA